MASSLQSTQKAVPDTRRYLTGAVLLALMLAKLVYLYTSLAPAGVIAAFLTCLLPLLAVSLIGWREVYLLSICGALAATAAFISAPVLEWTAQAIQRAAYLASFILLMAMLREGATTSPAVLDVGRFLTLQPARRRFATVFAGAHFFSVLINLGSLSLLAPIIQRGVRADRPEGEPLSDIDKAREQRQLTASLRGFSWFLVWAPTAVTQAVMPTLMSGIDAGRLILTGLCLASLMFGLSWLEDSLSWRGFRNDLQRQGRLPAVTPPALPRPAFAGLAGVCATLFALTLVWFHSANVTIVTAVMATVPFVVTGWIYFQQPASSPAAKLTKASKRYGEIAFTTLPGYIREAIFVGCAGFIGTMAAKLVPADQVAQMLSLAAMPGWLFLTLLSVTVLAFGQIGMSPITSAVFLGSLVAELPVLPADITLAALAIAAGTAICSTGAPFAAGPVLLARVTGYSSQTLTWRWNALYTPATIIVLAFVYAGLDIIW